jgi:hypothetical protein
MLIFYQPLLSIATTKCQFHQRFTRKFFVRTSFRQLFSSYMYVKKRCLYKKFVCKMLMKLTANAKRITEEIIERIYDPINNNMSVA